ncbi:hypothetical protein MK489_06675 [Myxococcota bacterium]|nr:hypothetical protein [Myxococcota bacterium]
MATAVFVLLASSACSTAAVPSVPKAAATPEEVLRLYEQIRASLASDEGGLVPGLSLRLAAVAREASVEASGATRSSLQEVSASAEALGALRRSSIEDLRLGFGNVSRAVVELILADEGLAKGRFIFRCPMSMGYKKWVQASAEMENPYMGSRMLQCGSETEWKP